ncbi:MAG: hypothetical protein GY862_27055 [Gammaproteobacteria bacterium]|nr:hypothetical protein [Gammaproteobacteria bacterium]MCP5013854.1 hypothetical protein [Ketobacter sp.]
MTERKPPGQRYLEQIQAELRAQKKYGMYRWVLKDLAKREAVFDRMYGGFSDYHRRVLEKEASLKAEQKERAIQAQRAAQVKFMQSVKG